MELNRIVKKINNVCGDDSASSSMLKEIYMYQRSVSERSHFSEKYKEIVEKYVEEEESK
jgi:hypothetical protein